MEARRKDAWIFLLIFLFGINLRRNIRQSLKRISFAAMSAKARWCMMALPIVGDFLVRTYNDPNIDINRDDTFPRPALWAEQVCDESVEATELEDEFFE